MKPHDETWTQDDGRSIRNHESVHSEAIALFSCQDDLRSNGYETSKARARLAAQAPAMARWILRELEPRARTASELSKERDEIRAILRDAGVLP